MGIEPTRPAWKAGVLPLNYVCTRGTPHVRIPAAKRFLFANILRLVAGMAGFEPAECRSQSPVPYQLGDIPPHALYHFITAFITATPHNTARQQCETIDNYAV